LLRVQELSVLGSIARRFGPKRKVDA